MPSTFPKVITLFNILAPMNVLRNGVPFQTNIITWQDNFEILRMLMAPIAVADSKVGVVRSNQPKL